MLEAYDIYLMRNGEIYIPTYPIEIKIKTTALDDKKYALVYIDEDGSVEYVASAYDGEYVTFEIEHLSDFGIATKKVSNGNVTPNTDVGEDTTGTGDTTNIAGLASIGIFAIIGFIVFYRRKGSL
jgi:hypothetical protein